MQPPISINFFIHATNKLEPLTYARAINIVFFNLLTMLVLPVLSLVFYTFNDTNNAFAILILELFLVIPLFITKYTNKLTLASHTLILILFFLINCLMLNEYRLLSTLGYWMAFIPILAALLINLSAGFYWALICILTTLCYFIFQKYTDFPTITTINTLPLRTLSICSLILALYLLIYFFEVNKHKKSLRLKNLLTQQEKDAFFLNQTIKERNDIEKTLQYLAHYDQVTGLPNRALYYKLLEKTIRKAKKNHSKIFILYLDLDNFKDINNMIGHYAGDLFLIEICKQFKKVLTKNDALCRLSGDEFMFILKHAASINDTIRMANKLIQLLLNRISIKKYNISSGASIGIAVYPDHGNDNVTLTKNAEIAMHHAKANGKGIFKIYDEELNQQTQKQLLVENHLRDALKNNEFHIAYQPQYDSKTRAIISLEALIRWNSSELGVIDPEVFIPLAEKIGIINIIGEWVLKNACLQFLQWQQAGLVTSSTKIAINLSILQMEQSSFFKNIKNVFNEVNIDPKFVEIELTESTINRSRDSMLTILNNLKSLGVSISMDDFGTGYSSFTRLTTYPLNVIKMDKSFLFNMAENNQHIINSIISLAHSLNLKIVAEGVESEEQYRFLKFSGCDYMQGFYLCPPLDAISMTAYFISLKTPQK